MAFIRVSSSSPIIILRGASFTMRKYTWNIMVLIGKNTAYTWSILYIADGFGFQRGIGNQVQLLNGHGGDDNRNLFDVHFAYLENPNQHRKLFS